MKRLLVAVFLIAALVSVSSVVGMVRFGGAQSGTNVIGIIESTTTWTQAGSPYNLTGNVLVPSGVTLIIQAGAILNLNTYYIYVNGTLNATGTSSNLININGGSTADYFTNPFAAINPSAITFHGSGDIEYANVNSQISIYSSDVEIAYTYGANILVLDGSPLITNNSLHGINVFGNSPTISNNYITGSVGVSGGSPIISNNNITGSVFAGGEFMQIKDNIIYGAITAGLTHTILIEGNLIVNTGNNGAGISMSGTEPEQIPEGTITIENNTIADSYYGVDVSFYGYQYVNTFYLNLAFNNFENITGYNLYWYSFTNLNATLNYWGTTDEQIINQSIYDSKNDFNLGTVTFTPFLTSPNPEAIPNPNAPIPTPYLSPTETPTPTQSPTQTPTLSPTPIPTPSPSVPEFPTWTILFLTATATLLTALFIKRKLQLSSQKIVR